MLRCQYVNNNFNSLTVQSFQAAPRSHSQVLEMLFTHQKHFWPDLKRVIQCTLRSEIQNVPERGLRCQYVNNNFNHQSVHSVQAGHWSYFQVIEMRFTPQKQFWPDLKRVIQSTLRSEIQHVPERVLRCQYFNNNFNSQSVQTGPGRALVVFSSDWDAIDTPETFLTRAQMGNIKHFAK